MHGGILSKEDKTTYNRYYNPEGLEHRDNEQSIEELQCTIQKLELEINGTAHTAKDEIGLPISKEHSLTTE